MITTTHSHKHWTNEGGHVMDNLGVVCNEHLRQDIGAVLSWEQNIGPWDSSTVYVRSHHFGV